MLFLSNDEAEIRNHLKEGMPRAYGPQLLLKLYTREGVSHNDNGEKGRIIIPDSVREEEIYQTIVGLVLDQGPDCFKDSLFENWGKPCVGEWVLFRPNSGVRFQYDGVPLRFVYDDCILCHLPNPALVGRS